MVEMKKILKEVEKLIKFLTAEEKEMLKESKIIKGSILSSVEFEILDNDTGYIEFHIRLDPRIKKDD